MYKIYRGDITLHAGMDIDQAGWTQRKREHPHADRRMTSRVNQTKTMAGHLVEKRYTETQKKMRKRLFYIALREGNKQSKCPQAQSVQNVVCRTYFLVVPCPCGGSLTGSCGGGRDPWRGLSRRSPGLDTYSPSCPPLRNLPRRKRRGGGGGFKSHLSRWAFDPGYYSMSPQQTEINGMSHSTVVYQTSFRVS